MELAFLAPLLPVMAAGSAGPDLFRPALPGTDESDAVLGSGVVPHSERQRIYLETLESVVIPGMAEHGVDTGPLAPGSTGSARRVSRRPSGPERQRPCLDALSSLALLLALPLLAAATQVTGEPTAGFHGRGPGGFSLEGKTHQLRVEDDGTTLRIVVPLAGLQTGIALRDRHMRERYLEVEKYPDAVLELPWSGGEAPRRTDRPARERPPGKMTLHGKSHDVQVKYRVVAHRQPLPGDAGPCR